MCFDMLGISIFFPKARGGDGSGRYQNHTGSGGLSYWSGTQSLKDSAGLDGLIPFLKNTSTESEL